MDTLENARNLVKGSGFALASNVINGAIGFATSVLIARTLGAERYGEFSLTLAIVGMFTVASSLGIGSAATRFIGDFLGRKKYAAAAGTARTSAEMTLVIFSASSLLLYFLAGALSGFFAKDIALLLRIMAAGLLLGGAMNFLLSVMQGFQLFGYYSLTETAHNLSKFVAIAFLLGAGLQAAGAAAGIVVGYAFSVAIGLILLAKGGVNFEKKERLIRPVQILKMGVPLAAAVYLLFLTTRGTTYLLGIFTSSAEVGVYSATLIFGYEFFVLSDALTAAFFPVLSAVHGGGGKEKFSNFFGYAVKFSALVVLPIIAYIGIFAPQILGLFLGANYSQSIVALRILLLLGLFYFIYALCSSAFAAMGQPGTVFSISVVPLVSVFAFGWRLIPRYGVNGAALTDSISYGIAAATAVWVLQKKGGISFPLRAVSRAAASSLGMSLFLFYTSGSITTIQRGLFLSLSAVIVYSILLFVFRAFDETDIDLFEKIFRGSAVYPFVQFLCKLTRKILRLEVWAQQK